jgi:hypothetical protein
MISKAKSITNAKIIASKVKKSIQDNFFNFKEAGFATNAFL